MQAMGESRQQSFEEIYGPPENFLEIEVRRTGLPPHPPTPVYRIDESLCPDLR